MENVQRIDFTSASAPTDFVASLHQTGFAVVYNHTISEQQINDLYLQWEAFFLSESKPQTTIPFRPDDTTGLGTAHHC